MGKEASFQAIPEDCDLLKRARSNRELAELMQNFNSAATRTHPYPALSGAAEIAKFSREAKALVQAHPGLLERYYYGGSRCYDKIVYLLSPARRAEKWGKNDDSLIHQAIYGTEPLHPEAQASQGRPIGLVPMRHVKTIAAYLASITREAFHEHYDPDRMIEMMVYKSHPDPNGTYFEWAWEEFMGTQKVYQQAADHDEAMIIVID